MNHHRSTNGFEDRYPLKTNHACGIPDRESVVDNYVTGKLSEADEAAFAEHSFYCAQCSEDIRFKMRLIKMLDQQALPVPFYEKYRLPLVAAAIIVLVSVIWVLTMIQEQHAGAQAQIFAENSEPSLNFEDLVKRHQRRASAITVIHPENGFNATDQVEFRWEGLTGNELVIKILNNREDTILTLPVEKNYYLLKQAAQKLPPGLYYWKLEDMEDLYYVGKFFVDKPAF